jgi:hypothetical protein
LSPGFSLDSPLLITLLHTFGALPKFGASQNWARSITTHPACGKLLQGDIYAFYASIEQQNDKYHVLAARHFVRAELKCSRDFHPSK